jgi:putative redox protein
MRIDLIATPDLAIHASSPENGYSFRMGAAEKVGGDGQGMRPMETLLAALGGCAVVDTVLILKKSRVDFEEVRIQMVGARAEGTPSPFTEIKAVFTVMGKDVPLEKAEKAVKLSVEKYCSVASSLNPGIRILHEVQILTTE